jgi:hypothetical protein
MKLTPHTILIFTLIAVPFGAAQSSQSQRPDPKPTETQGRDCELNALHLSDIAQKVLHSDERLFVIARLGKSETNRSLNRRRLYNVRVRLKPYFDDRAKSGHLTLAEGEPTNGAGCVEFYIGSKLVLITSLAHQADICVDCCESQHLYYGPGRFGRKWRKNTNRGRR